MEAGQLRPSGHWDSSPRAGHRVQAELGRFSGNATPPSGHLHSASPLHRLPYFSRPVPPEKTPGKEGGRGSQSQHGEPHLLTHSLTKMACFPPSSAEGTGPCPEGCGKPNEQTVCQKQVRRGGLHGGAEMMGWGLQRQWGSSGQALRAQM